MVRRSNIASFLLLDIMITAAPLPQGPAGVALNCHYSIDHLPSVLGRERCPPNASKQRRAPQLVYDPQDGTWVPYITSISHDSASQFDSAGIVVPGNGLKESEQKRAFQHGHDDSENYSEPPQDEGKDANKKRDSQAAGRPSKRVNCDGLASTQDKFWCSLKVSCDELPNPQDRWWCHQNVHNEFDPDQTKDAKVASKQKRTPQEGLNPFEGDNPFGGDKEPGEGGDKLTTPDVGLPDGGWQNVHDGVDTGGQDHNVEVKPEAGKPADGQSIKVGDNAEIDPRTNELKIDLDAIEKTICGV